MTWDKDHWSYKCSDGQHDSFWKTVVESPQWAWWELEQQKRLEELIDNHLKDSDAVDVYDMAEVKECGWISQEHFQAFLKFIRTRL